MRMIFAGLETATGAHLTGDLERIARVFSAGPLLHAVQMAGIFEDSKHFVDMPLKQEPEVVLAAYEALQDKSPEALSAFVSSYFKEPGSELEAWTPPDSVAEPPRLMAIKDESLRSWALALNKLWAQLGRKMSPSVAQSQQLHSVLAQRSPMVVPGGRFRETYYWDTYWIVLGLLECGMVQTATGVVENLLDAVRHFGFVPNGMRIYYLDRSQPPLLTDMALAVYKESQDRDWLASVLPVLEKEYDFWMRPEGGRAVRVPSADAPGGAYTLNVFRSVRTGPRPESYKEDMETAQGAQRQGRAPQEVFQGLTSGAETGWDFSSRWLKDADGGPALGTAELWTIRTPSVVPVDLNAILHRVETGLAWAHQELGTGEGGRFTAAAALRAEAMQRLLWSGDSFRDLILDASPRPSAVVALSNWAAPLWAGLYGPGQAEQSALAMVASLSASGLLRPGGNSTTMVDSGGKTQWDAPNAWPPLQHMLVEGLANLPRAASQRGQELASYLAQTWIATCHEAWAKNEAMFEKYNADVPGMGGGGGEYKPQLGFGWSNGVALVLLTRYAS